jgi:tripeptide aminopeptidase
MSEVNKDRLFKTFRELAEISSPSYQEAEVIVWLEKWAKKLKLEFEKLPCDRSFNVVIRIPATVEGKKSLMFSGHTDTVTPCDNITVVETETRFESDGTTILGGDDKAGLAAILEAVNMIQEEKIPHGQIELLFTCAEEIGLLGMKGMDMTKVSPDFTFVLDSGGPIGSVAIEAPYHTTMKINLKGKAAHAGMEPEKGKSAITCAAHIISSLELGRIDEETTANIGTISGGKATNIVAEDAYFNLEVRSRNKSKLAAAEKKIKDTIRGVAKQHGVKVFIDRKLEYSGYRIKENAPILKLFNKACAELKIKPMYEAHGGGSDTNILNGAKHQAVNISCGMAKVHTTSEFVKKTDLVKSAGLVYSIIANI